MRDHSSLKLRDNQLVDVLAHGGVDKGERLDVGVENEGIAALTAYLAKEFDESDFQWGHGVLFGLGQLLAAFFLEGDVLLHQFLKLCLTLLEDGLGEFVLSIEEFLVLAVELVFYAFGLSLIEGSQVVHLLLYGSVFGHRLEGCFIAEETKF